MARCSGHRMRGYWKGYPCGAVPIWRDEHGKLWCQSHLPILKGEPPTRLTEAERRNNAAQANLVEAPV